MSTFSLLKKFRFGDIKAKRPGPHRARVRQRIYSVGDSLAEAADSGPGGHRGCWVKRQWGRGRGQALPVLGSAAPDGAAAGSMCCCCCSSEFCFVLFF